MIDCHVHLAALTEAGNGCFISPRLLRSPAFRFLRFKFGLSLDDPRGANRKYVDALLAELRASRFVQQAVVLGMDGVYDSRGEMDAARTEFLVCNDYVLNVTRDHPGELLAGVSINPRRRDALDELHRCADAGAILVKVLPNAQQFDPADHRHRLFYRALAERKLPLLSHVGHEFTLVGRDQSAGDPGRLRVPLEEGVTVIAAHACSLGLVIYEKFLATFRDLVRRYPNFHADVSALTLPNRCGMPLRLRREPEIQQRLVFGTDYPLPVFHLPAWGRAGLGTLREIVRTKNRFDRQHLVCRALGVSFHSFERLRARGHVLE